MSNYLMAMPEIFVLTMASLTLIVDLFIPKDKKDITLILVLFTLIGAAGITTALFFQPDSAVFSGMYVHDRLSDVLKILIYVTSFFAFVYSRSYIKTRKIHQGEYYLLGLFSVLGMMVIVSSNNLLTLFLGLEIFSLPLYAMIAMQRDVLVCSEASVKYYIMGAMASGILLYGMSMLFGATKNLDLATIATIISQTPLEQQYISLFAVVLLVVGLAFKFGAAPFHMWAPDVYQGAPTSVTLFIGSAPKIAAVGLALRILTIALPSLDVQWQQLLILIALLSMALGNIVAIVQTNIKRMLAYSSIAHMGYMSLGLLTATPDGYAASLFYILNYAIMATASFAAVIFLSRSGFEAENISDFRGLNSRNPWLALMMLIIMFSMAGIPPTVGFFAKLGVLEALVNAHFVWLAAIALVFAVIGAYYYLAIVKVMYFEEPEVTAPLTSTLDMKLVMIINSLSVLLLGMFPSALIDLCRSAF